MVPIDSGRRELSIGIRLAPIRPSWPILGILTSLVPKVADIADLSGSGLSKSTLLNNFY